MTRNRYNRLTTSSGSLEPIVEHLGDQEPAMEEHVGAREPMVEHLGYQEMEIIVTPPDTGNHLQLPLCDM